MAAPYSVEMIEARLEVIRRVRESWKGQPGYVETIDMEIWVFDVAAKLVRTCAKVIDFQVERMGIVMTPQERADLVQLMCSSIDGSNSLMAIFGPDYKPPAAADAT